MFSKDGYVSSCFSTSCSQGLDPQMARRLARLASRVSGPMACASQAEPEQAPPEARWRMHPGTMTWHGKLCRMPSSDQRHVAHVGHAPRVLHRRMHLPSVDLGDSLKIEQ